MKRKIALMFLVIMMIFASVSVLFACDNSSNDQTVDTFSGSLSAKGYATASDAAKAYLTEEFAGDTENLVFDSYEKKQDLSREEIAELPLGEYKESDVEKAEKGEIKYFKGTAARTLDENEIEVEIKFVVLVFVDGKYHSCIFVSLPGEKISKSYYTSVLDLSQHDSYVYETKNTFKVQSVPAGEIGINYTSTGKMIYTKNAVYFEVKVDGLYEVTGTQDIDAIGYVLPKDENSCIAFIRYKLDDDTDCEWKIFEEEGGINEYSINYIMAMDQTYFVKTKDGFKLDEKKYAQYLEKIYGELYAILAANVKVKTNSASAVYHVKDGLLSSSEGAFNLTLTDDNVTMKLITSNKTKLSEINQATVNVPQEILDVMKLYTAQACSV